MKPSYCSPSHSGNSGTCFSDGSLIKLANAYNKTHTDKIPTPTSKPDMRLSSDKRSAIWKSLLSKLKKNNELPCEDEYCVLYTDVAESVNDREIHENTFRPERPENWYDNPSEWLTNLDIENVMKQYEETHSDFAFLGPSPIDFDAKIDGNSCVEQSICDLSLRNMLQKGKRRVGIVFNLDPHYKSGSHWTAMMCDMNSGGIYYFDSYGVQPPQEVRMLMARLRSQGNQLINDNLLSAAKMRPIHIYPISGRLSNAFEFQTNQNDIASEGGASSNSKRVRKLQSGDICHLMEGGRIVDKTPLRIRQVKPGNIIVFESEIPAEYRTKLNSGKCNIVRKDFEELFNTTRFQFGNSECGMFSMYFLLQFLENKNFYDIVRTRINDRYVWKKRDEYFRPNIRRIPQLPTGREGANADKSSILAALVNGGRESKKYFARGGKKVSRKKK